MNEKEIIEIMARVEHERWAKWQKYLHSKCTVYRNGTVSFPHDLFRHWERQIKTPYSELSEREKEMDREEARTTMKALLDEGFEII